MYDGKNLCLKVLKQQEKTTQKWNVDPLKPLSVKWISKIQGSKEKRLPVKFSLKCA